MVGTLVDRGVIRGTTATEVRGWNAVARQALSRGETTADQVEKPRDAAARFNIADKLNIVRGGTAIQVAKLIEFASKFDVPA